jgi:hypothetical protein
VNHHSAKFYLLLGVFFSGLLASTAFSQESGKKPDDPPASQPAKTAKTITGKAHLVRAGEQTEAFKGSSSASDVSITFYLSDDKKSIVRISVSVGEIKYGFRDEAGGATVNGSTSDVLITTTTDLGSAITKGRFILPAEAKGTLHLFYTYRRTSDYKEFRFDLGEWEFDAK